MHTKMKHRSRTVIALLLAMVMMLSLVPTAFAAQENGYHDPAEHWLTANNRTNELDANAVVTRETFYCSECGKQTSFEAFRTPEYTRDAQTAMSRNVKYSDGTLIGGSGTGSILDGTPGVDSYYTGYHWTKAVCETCGTINSNMGTSDYGYGKNVYWLYDCAAEFMEDLDETVTYEYVDDTYHSKTTEGGEYCCFCYGTHHTESTVLERHDLETDVLSQPANGRFAIVEHCTLCDYQTYEYVTAKAVVADYYGVADGQPHTITVSDLSDAGVRTSIRYGNSATSCTLTSAPNYTEEGQYLIYYAITYTYNGVDMTENGVANVWLRDETTNADGSCSCGCGNPDCGCQDKDCNGCCCDTSCGESHNYILLDSTEASCLTLGYDRYLCTKCGKIEKRDYVAALGHAWQSIVIREATCETEGKVLEICARCGQVKETSTPMGEHSYKTYTVSATCTSPGYTVKECTVCGDRHITNITNANTHNYETVVTPATCETGGHTTHICYGCGSSFITDYTDSLGHCWDEGTIITTATCDGSGVTEYRCERCGYHRLEGDASNGHTPGATATCTTPQVCTECGVVLAVATGHKVSEWIIDKEPTTDSEGSRHKECTVCGETLETEAIEKLYMSATTDTHGEAVVGGYLVTVTDTDTKNPVSNATVVLNKDNTLSIRLPDGRLLTYEDQTTITVQMVKDKSAVSGMGIAVTDKNGNYSADSTNAAGQITVPGTSGKTNEDGNATVGGEDENGNRYTITVKVEDYETGRPIEDATVSIGKTGTITVVLPDGVDMDAANRITITVTDNKKNPLEDKDIIVKNDLGQTATGKTDEAGQLTVPAVAEVERHSVYIYGYPDGTFGPERSMTRAEASAIFARILAAKNGDIISGTASTKFSDIPTDAWYSGYVKYLTGYGIAAGYSDKTYHPDDAITRAEFTAMAVRFFEVYGDGNAEIMEQYSNFNDVSEGYWAAEYIQDAAIHGWIVGYGDGTFRADDEITRAEVVTIVNRLLDRTADTDYIADNLSKLNTFSDMSKRHWAYYAVMEAANAHISTYTDDVESWSK